MIIIYHNPRCTKSRQAKQFLEEKGVPFEVREYLKEPLNEKELKTLLKKLQIPAQDLIRTIESVWKENYKGKELTEDELIKAMMEHPKLIQRPIIVNGEKAVIGRPSEEIEKLL